MNRTFLKGLFLLTAAFSIATAQAATSGDNQREIFRMRTFKVDGRLLGVTEDYRVMAIVCGYRTADLVEPNTRGELNFEGYNATGRTPAVNRARFRTVTGEAMAKLCGPKTGDFTLAVQGQVVQLLEAVPTYANFSSN